MKAIDALGQQAVNLVMQGAVDVIRQRGLSSNDLDLDALTALLRERAKAAILVALDEAREAFAANMAAIAVSTFNASMRLVGIKTTTEFLGGAR